MPPSTRPLPDTPSTTAPDPGMVWVPGGTFRMGSEAFYPEERPVRHVAVDGFWMDRHPVTNAQFRRFVQETGYLTVAERAPNPADYPNALPEFLVPGSLVFQRTEGPVDLRNWANWWTWRAGACWRHPEGPGSSIAKRGRHPVVHVAYADVQAYCAWAGKRLPSEAGWEFAARGGLDGATFSWGEEEFPADKPMVNAWQGEFPWQNLARDGYPGTSPVGAFPANGYGLFDVTGNVWEWTDDWYAARHGQAGEHPCCMAHNPRGGREEESYDPAQPEVRIPRKVIKGGSFLCAPNYCFRYRPAARQAQMLDTGTCHLGFRCVVR